MNDQIEKKWWPIDFGNAVISGLGGINAAFHEMIGYPLARAGTIINHEHEPEWPAGKFESGISICSAFDGQPNLKYSPVELVLNTTHLMGRIFRTTKPNQDFLEYFANEEREDNKLQVTIPSETAHFESRAQQYLSDLIDCDKRWSLEERVLHRTTPSGCVDMAFPFRLLQRGNRNQFDSTEPVRLPEIILSHYQLSRNGTYELTNPPANRAEGLELIVALNLLDKEGKISISDESLEIHADGLFLRCTLAHVEQDAAYVAWVVKRLSYLQELVSSGVVSGAIVEFVGQFDPEILNRIQSKNVGHLGVCPDVELVYTLPLPSAEVYNVDLKEARYFNKRRQNRHAEYTDEDREIISGVKEYLAETSRLNPWLFGQKWEVEKLTETPLTWRQKVEVNTQDYGFRKIPVETYVMLLLESQLQESWQRFSDIAVKKSAAEPPAITTPLLPARELFEERVRICLEDRLPEFTKSLRSDDYFILSAEERRDFLATYVDELYSLQERECTRIIRELQSPEIHAARTATGYQGPEGGWSLRFEYQVMDMIVDMRQKQSFRQKRASRDKITPNEVEVPEHIGRTFDKQDRFLTVESVAEILNKSKASRVIEVEIFDAESATTQTQVLSPEGLQEYLRELDRLNLEHLAVHLNEPQESNDFPYPLLSIHQRVFELAHERIEQLEAAHAEKIAERKQNLREIGESISQNHSLKKELLLQKQGIIDAGAVADLFHAERIALIRANLITMLREIVPHLYGRHCLDIKSIHDYQITKLIYCVRADGTIPVEEEQPGTLKRASHSELLGGQNGYGMGEFVFARFDQLFMNPTDWLEFNRQLKITYPETWNLVEINNHSGHYLPPPITLPYVRNLVSGKLSSQGIDTESTKLVDRLKPGLKIQNNLNYWGRKAAS